MIYYGSTDPVELSNLTPLLDNVRSFIDTYITTNDFREFYRRSWSIDGSQNFNTLPDDWPYHPIKLDSLFWPVGASSWAVGHYLVTDSTLKRIRAQAYAGGTYHSLPLKIDDGMGGVISPSMWMLSARPISQIVPPISYTAIPPDCDGVYLLTLVDDRYYWQSLRVSLLVDNSSTWADVLTMLKDVVSFTNDTPNAAYLQPSTALWGTDLPFSLVMDSVAYTLGMRVIRTLTGSVKMINAGTSRTQFSANLSVYTNRLAGGRFAFDNTTTVNDLIAEAPSSVKVVFQQANFSVTSTPAGLGLTDYAGYTGNGQTRQFLVNTNGFSSFGIVLSSHVLMTTLAQQIATDYYRWLIPGLDMVLAGVAPWTGEAHSFMTQWEHSLAKDLCTTRLLKGRDDGQNINEAWFAEKGSTPPAVPPPPVTEINYSTIENFTTPFDGQLYFNTYDQNIYFRFGGVWFILCPCGKQATSLWWCLLPPPAY
jgi:hypothetical protein